MAATKAAMSLWRRLLGAARRPARRPARGRRTRAPSTCPRTRAEALIHLYSGGGVTAHGPGAAGAQEHRSTSVSLSGSYYVDAVSNASIDVVTTASKYNEMRNEFGLERRLRLPRLADHASAARRSHEPDYTANTGSLDVTQEVFGGMTTVALGFTRGDDKVRQARLARVPRHAPRTGSTGSASTQILTPRWTAERERRGDLRRRLPRQPVPRRARVRRRGARAQPAHAQRRARCKFRLRRRPRLARRRCTSSYRYYWDTWDIKAHTAELGYSRYFGDALAGRRLRALLHARSTRSSTATTRRRETTYVSRNRQLSTFNDVGLGAKLAYTVRKVPGKLRRQAQRRLRVHALQVQGLHRRAHRQPVLATTPACCSCSCRPPTETAMFKRSCKLIIAVALAAALLAAGAPIAPAPARAASAAPGTAAVRDQRMRAALASSPASAPAAAPRAGRCLRRGRIGERAGDGARGADAGRAGQRTASPARSTAASRTSRATSSSSTATCSCSRRSCCSRPTRRWPCSSRWTSASCSSSTRCRSSSTTRSSPTTSTPRSRWRRCTAAACSASTSAT